MFRGGPEANLPEGLPSTFSYGQARVSGLSERQLYRLRDTGTIARIGRGLFQRVGDDLPDGDPDLVEIAHRAPRATLCLITGLARHDLTDIIPAAIDVALPRGVRHPRVEVPVAWHSFASATFDIDREQLPVTDGLTIGIYGPQRCIVDAFRLRHQEGDDVAVEALRRWLRQPGAQPGRLLAMAGHFPKAQPALRAALQVLL